MHSSNGTASPCPPKVCTPCVQEEPTPAAGTKKSGWGADADDGNDDVSAPVVAPPRRRRGLDGDNDDATANKHNDATTTNKHDIPEINDDDDDTIANLIPDLEDEQEDMARQVSALNPFPVPLTRPCTTNPASWPCATHVSACMHAGR